MKYLSLTLIGVLIAGPLAAAPKAPPQPILQQRLELLERKQRAISDLVIRLDALQQEVRQLRGELELQSHALDVMKKRQRELYLDMDQRLAKLGQGAAGGGDAPAPAPVVPTQIPPAQPASPGAPGQQQTTPAGTGVVSDATGAPPMVAQSGSGATATAQAPVAATIADPALEETSYQKAFDLLMQGRYDESRTAFRTFLANYPASRLAGNAQYWLAESSYVTRDFDTALVEFTKVLELYPDSSKVADALLKSGFIHYEQKRWQQARTTLQQVVDRYPSSTAARLAAKRLQRMSGEGR